MPVLYAVSVGRREEIVGPCVVVDDQHVRLAGLQERGREGGRERKRKKQKVKGFFLVG